MIDVRTLSRREKILAALSSAVLAGGGLYVYLVEPVFTRWTDLHAETVRLRDEYATLVHLKTNEDAIESGFASIEDAIVGGDSVEALQLSLMKDVEALARKSGLRVSNIKPLSQGREGLYYRLGIQVTGICEHHQFVNFVQAIQRPENLMRVEAMTIVAGRGTPPLDTTVNVSKLVQVEGGQPSA